MTGAYWISIFILTHLPPTTVPKTRVSDKALHFGVYAILGVLLHLSVRPRAWKKILLVLAVLLLYGAMDELTQPLVGRFCSFDDWLADAAGAAVALSLCAAVERFLKPV